MSPQHRSPLPRLIAWPAVSFIAAALVVVGNANAEPSPTPAARPAGPAKTHDVNAIGRRCDHGLECVTASGFEPGQAVLVRQFHKPHWREVLRADRRGFINTRVAAHGRGDVLTFVGQASGRLAIGSGNVSVSVPRIAIFHL